MKLEKLNDSQIRCTFTKKDLADRKIKLSEFAYGTPKTKELFREVMSWAAYEFGFETQNVPLMIEAVPVSSDSIMLIVTKVENPDILDGRYSKFSPTEEEEGEPAPPPKKTPKKITIEPWDQEDGCYPKLFTFASMADLIRAANHVPQLIPEGKEEADILTSRLYFDAKSHSYKLYTACVPDASVTESFDRICTMLSEYGTRVKLPAAGDVYLQEHYETVMKENVFGTLSAIS